MTIRRRRNKRRGILLLLVLSLLVLFVLIGTTFIIVAGHYKTASDAHAKHELTGDAPQDQLDSALMELIRGSTNPTSPLRNNSLLEDTYGTDGFFGTVVPQAFEKFGGSAATPDHVTSFIGNDRFLQIVFRAPIRNPNVPLARHELHQTQSEIMSSDFYAGSVVTMLSGPAAGRSARIVRYSAPTVVDANTDGIDDDLILNDGVIIIKMFDDIESVSGLLLNTPAGRNRFILELSRSSSFIVNGRVHNGTGTGYVADNSDPDFGSLEETDQFGTTAPYEAEVALLPFYQGNLRHAVGGLDESWDAADYQNVFLAMEPNPLFEVGVDELHEALPIPSLHRPFLVNYWGNRLLGDFPSQIESCLAERDFQMPTGSIFASQWSRFRRSVIARPLAIEHPFFNGSNVAFSHPGFPGGVAAQTTPGSGIYQLAPHPQFNRDGDNIPDFIDPDIDGDGMLDDFNGDGLADMAAVSGPWDVDNDNDGTPDSVWVDLGFPVQSTKDGRLFKPLFAIHCVDLDGKLNVNAHGTTAHLLNTTDPIVYVDGSAQPIFPLMTASPPATSPATTLSAIPTQPATVRGQGYGPPEVNLVRALDSISTVATLNPAAFSPFNPFQSLLVNRLRGVANANSGETSAIAPVPGALSAVYPEMVNMLSEVGVPNNYAINGQSYATPPDLHGRGMVVVDRLGQPYQFNMGLVGEIVNDPYETNLVEPTAYDSLYSVAELEALYRYFDPGSENISSRLTSYFGALSPLQGQDVARLFTTRSSSIPTSNVILGLEHRKEAGTLTELMKQILLNQNPTVANEAWLNQQVIAMLPPELRGGRKMDVNRLFGNGFDDTPNGIPNVIDDPLENGVDPDGDGLLNTPTDRQQAFGAAGVSVNGRFFQDVGTVTDAMGTPSVVETPTYAPARQTYARHLYCLAMLVTRDFEWPGRDLSTPLAPADAARLKARRLAQWAINVVDFRDNDSIMTPFEYDENPFDGWDVDGNIAADATLDGPQRQMVWGVEQPELLITETLATHNRGVRDLNTESDPDTDMAAMIDDAMNPDVDLDQYRKPEGSLFLELHSPRSPVRNHDNRQSFANELYIGGFLDLNRVAPGARRVPVWRVAITKHVDTDRHAATPSFEVRMALATSDFEEFQPPDSEIDRIVWFSSLADGVDPTSVNSPERIYYNMGAANSARLLPGSIAVIGPRLETIIGTQLGTDEPGQNIDMGSTPRVRHFMTDKDPATLVEFDKPESANTGEYIGAAGPLQLLCGRPSPYDTAAGSKPTLAEWNVGLNVSEPDPIPLSSVAPVSNYYPDPNPTNDTADPDRLLVYRTVYDKPFDQDIAGNREVLPVGTNENYATALLQRLANPSLPWNPTSGHPDHIAGQIVNPYMTVDWAPIDLHVYNGEGDLTEGADPPPQAAVPLEFSSRERSSLTPIPPTIGAPHPIKNIWTSRVIDPTTSDKAFIRRLGEVYRTYTPSSHKFNIPLLHSLGYLNPAFGWNTNRPSSGYPLQVVVPLTPFPSLTWNNRPFVSTAELMQVPVSSPGRLTFDHNPSTDDPYDGSTGPVALSAPFGHLMNFFHGSTDDTDPSIGANLALLLDLLEVPSRFVGTQERLNQQLSAYDLNGWGMPLGLSTAPISWRSSEFMAPFNQLPLFRDPGKINLNTVNNPHVLAALGGGVDYDDFRRSRRQADPGSAVTVANLRNVPTRFANPFRAASSADLMPLNSLRPDEPAQATLLRADPSANDLPLFHDSNPTLQGNTDWNSRFRYQHMQRIQNSVTTQSNVFAVWITVGYFEALPWNPNNPLNTSVTPVPDFAHPDGYQLGQEIGIDTGEVERHRAFYIIDRSIPVAFEPGENHNVEDAILLKRFIE